MRGSSAQGDAASGRVVHIGHHRAGGAGHGLGGAKAVGIAGQGPHAGAHLRLAQGEGAGGGPGNGAPGLASVFRHLPLVADRAHAVGVGQGVHRSEYLVLAGGPAQGELAHRRVVHIGDRQTGGAGHGLGDAIAVGVAGHNAHLGAHLRLRECERGSAGLGNVAPGCAAVFRRLPLVADRAQAISVGQGVGRRENLVLLGGALEGDSARGCAIELGRHVRRSPQRPVCKTNGFNGIGTAARLRKLHAVRRARPQNNLIANPRRDDLAGDDARAKLQHIVARRFLYDINTTTQVMQVGVVACAAIDDVVAVTAVEDIVTGIAVDDVVARAAADAVVDVAAV